MTCSLEQWKSSSAVARETAARRLVSSLPTGFAFHVLAGPNAIFTFESAKFVLIPGGIVSLGFDVERPWVPTPEETGSWALTAREYGFSDSIHERVCAVTLRPRRVELPTFLVETEARELGWESANLEDPKVVSMLKQYPAGFQLCSGGTTTRVHRKNDGLIIAEQSVNQTHADLLAGLRGSGFRFPTSDEWEYICGGGAPTLFRWGDHAPVDRYPIESAKRRKQREASVDLSAIPAGFAPDWDLHLKPNAFGISVAANPYHSELMAEIGITRGGDGGCTICGGSGYFVGWLTLATAYFEEQFCKHDPAEPIPVGYTFGRRVLDLH